jgi:hypothetical protein
MPDTTILAGGAPRISGVRRGGGERPQGPTAAGAACGAAAIICRPRLVEGNAEKMGCARVSM